MPAFPGEDIGYATDEFLAGRCRGEVPAEQVGDAVNVAILLVSTARQSRGWLGCRPSSRMMPRTSSKPQATPHRLSWAWMRR